MVSGERAFLNSIHPFTPPPFPPQNKYHRKRARPLFFFSCILCDPLNYVLPQRKGDTKAILLSPLIKYGWNF